MKRRVLVVDDEDDIRSFIAEALEGESLQVTRARDGQEAWELASKQSFHLVITDLTMPRMDGMTLVRKLRAETPETEVIVLTAHGTVATAVEAMKLGAFDYLQKPLSGPDELRLLVRRALETRALREESDRNRRDRPAALGMVAADPAMLAVADQIAKVAKTNASVLLLGESGTGKEVAARALHEQSPRHSGPFVAMNCAAITETCSRARSSATKKAPSPAPPRRDAGASNWPTAGRCSWTRWASSRPACSRSCSGSWRSGGSSAWAGRGRSRSTCGWSRPRIATSLRRWPRAASAPTSITGSRSSPSGCLRCANVKETSCRSRSTCWRGLAKISDGAGSRSPGRHAMRSWRATGRGTCANCATSSSGRRSCRRERSFRPNIWRRLGLPLRPRRCERRNARPSRQRSLRRRGHRKQAAERLGIGERTLYDKIKEYGLS